MCLRIVVLVGAKSEVIIVVVFFGGRIEKFVSEVLGYLVDSHDEIAMAQSGQSLGHFSGDCFHEGV